MQIIQTKSELESFYQLISSKRLSVGLTPTMGALHKGHMSLLHKSNTECDVSVVSIFVNPMQFNNQADLEKYPKTLEEDISLLEKNDCDFLFLPDKTFIYPENFEKIKLDISNLDDKMEGEFRPGHFEGVVNVVFRLFELIQPQKAYFGDKDFQQLAIISFMVEKLKLPINVIGCETTREENGLAMSSRNLRLNNEQKKKAGIIHETLKQGEILAKKMTPAQTKKHMQERFTRSYLDLEYIEIIHPKTLEPLDQIWVSKARVCIAAFCGEVRLIDNMQIRS